MNGNNFDKKYLTQNSKINDYALLEMLLAVDAAVCAHSDAELQEIMQAFFLALNTSNQENGSSASESVSR